MKNPTPDVSKAIVEARAEGKGVYPIYFYITINNCTSHSLYSHHSPCIKNIFLLLFTDADKKPVEDLTSLAAQNIENVLSKTQPISRGILLNVRQSWLKEWGSDSGIPSRGYDEGTANRGNFKIIQI